MTSAGSSDEFVPREFLGQARAFITRMQRAGRERDRSIAAIMDRIVNRLAGGRRIRYEQFPEIARALTECEYEGRLRFRVEGMLSCRTLTVSEISLNGMKTSLESWQDKTEELTLVLNQSTITVSKKDCKLEQHSVGYVGLHGLARRFQRGFDNADAAIFSDMVSIVLAGGHRAVAANADFEVTCPDGSWWGKLVYDNNNNSMDRVVPHLRTFYSNGRRSLMMRTPLRIAV
jgi:hypothetical protein